jgi:hypothetical protein
MTHIYKYLLLLFVLFAAAVSGCAAQKDKPDMHRPEPMGQNETASAPEDIKTNNIFGDPNDTEPTQTGRIVIRNVGEYEFKPAQIKSVRNDLFREGYFSIFDILVHLDARGDIDMDYHFDDAVNTHVIDSLNGERYWWYRAHYHMGWSENNAFRMDHFPYKDNMTVSIVAAEQSFLDKLYDVFRDEVQRKKDNNGKIVIQEVIIRGPGTRIELRDVEVTSHNLRKDMFQDDVITAIDAIMSLGERGELSYDLKWYENIGSAIIKNYFVQRINGDESFRRCGFVYEAGSRIFDGFRGNHIHLPPDTRVLNSPEYLSYFWICI